MTNGTGLSPRVWGSRVVPFLNTACIRSIPTCVGQPVDAALPEGKTAVYPHVCGAAICCGCGNQSGLGLSPRVWGSPVLVS